MTITTQQTQLVKDVVSKMRHAIDHRGTRPYISDLILEESKGERKFRNGWGAGREYPRNFGPKLAGEFNAVRHIVDFVHGNVPIPNIEDALFLKRTYIDAAAIAAAYWGEIHEAIPKHQADRILEMDYCKLVDMEEKNEHIT
jgi:hypothetical protein